MKQVISILGSTGSIGTQSLEIIEAHPELFELDSITAGSNWQLLVKQAIKFEPNCVVIANETFYMDVKTALASYPIKVYTGAEALCQVVSADCVDTVISALVGYAGLEPTVSAIKAGKKIALANKETLVVAGEYVTELSQQYNAPIIPVDSEHSAIFQSLVGECSEVEKIILTASGGPFFNKSIDELKHVTIADTLKHPNWSMGAKISVDSATMMNKGFEVIEAKWLFGLRPDQIEIVIHPQSVIHSMVQFCDGAIKAQLGTPDMKIPIQYALTYPERKHIKSERYDFIQGGSGVFNFHSVDLLKYNNLSLILRALDKGGNAPCVVNAANEIAVAAFLSGKLKFIDIYNVVAETFEQATHIIKPTLGTYADSNEEAREIAKKIINK